jgi:hypothetical protein
MVRAKADQPLDVELEVIHGSRLIKRRANFRQYDCHCASPCRARRFADAADTLPIAVCARSVRHGFDVMRLRTKVKEYILV